jgi:ribosomal protein S18 acetylase RimI-like enzyme
MTPPRLRAVAPSDFGAVHALMRRIEQHDRIPIATPLAEVEEWLDEPYLDLAADTRLVEAGGEVAAWGRVWHRPGGGREERALVLGGVDPAHRGRGLGTALLAWQVARAEERLRAGPQGVPCFVRAQAYDFQAADLRLFARHGLTPVRYNDELLRDLTDLPPRPDVPGIAIAPWDRARSEEARLAQNEAFADHWGSTERDAAAWAHDVAAYGTRLDLSFFALDGARIVGVCRNGHFPEDEAVHGRRDGWVINVSVVRSHRKRGIASALLVASLEAFARAGFTHSALGVDSENPTGAYGVYERLGYRPIHRLVVSQRPIRAPGA